jgi:hypothetical protein
MSGHIVRAVRRDGTVLRFNPEDPKFETWEGGFDGSRRLTFLHRVRGEWVERLVGDTGIGVGVMTAGEVGVADIASMPPPPSEARVIDRAEAREWFAAVGKEPPADLTARSAREAELVFNVDGTGPGSAPDMSAALASLARAAGIVTGGPTAPPPVRGHVVAPSRPGAVLQSVRVDVLRAAIGRLTRTLREALADRMSPETADNLRRISVAFTDEPPPGRLAGNLWPLSSVLKSPVGEVQLPGPWARKTARCPGRCGCGFVCRRA